MANENRELASYGFSFTKLPYSHTKRDGSKVALARFFNYILDCTVWMKDVLPTCILYILGRFSYFILIKFSGLSQKKKEKKKKRRLNTNLG